MEVSPQPRQSIFTHEDRGSAHGDIQEALALSNSRIVVSDTFSAVSRRILLDVNPPTPGRIERLKPARGNSICRAACDESGAVVRVRASGEPVV